MVKLKKLILAYWNCQERMKCFILLVVRILYVLESCMS